MFSYILRRLLLMIVTLVGITFVVFMLIALSPGGIGAGLNIGAGGAMQSQSGVAVTRAKMEDRYGLNDPTLVQYARWLGRISPIKFGPGDLVNPATGELIVAPRPVPEPSVWRWFASELPKPRPGLREAARAELEALAPETRVEAFKAIERAYVEARARFTVDDALLREALKRYIDEIDRPDLLDSQFRPRVRRLAELEPDTGRRNFPEARKHAEAALVSYQAGAEARERLLGAMAAAPYPRDGIRIIPGLVGLSWPDLGVAFSTGKPVRQMIANHLPTTLLINAMAIPIVYFIAIPSGILAAVRKGSFYDVGLGAVYIALYSVPTVLAGVLLLGYLATPDYFNAFPTAGLHDKNSADMTMLPGTLPDGTRTPGFIIDTMWHLVLPVLCSVYAGFAFLSKLTRGTMLDNFNADYVRTAKAKGVADKDVVFRHVFRNSLLPLITVFVAIFPGMLAGSVVIERIFSIQGMGWLAIEAINLRDREMILANTVIIAAVNLVALLLADILYAVADPRITYK
jgi:ABC-type dipeptide/oligopeptide/nickel transport system permease component